MYIAGVAYRKDFSKLPHRGRLLPVILDQSTAKTIRCRKVKFRAMNRAVLYSFTKKRLFEGEGDYFKIFHLSLMIPRTCLGGFMSIHIDYRPQRT